MHELVFERRSKLHESEERVQFERLSKTYERMFYQTARETMLLLVNNIHMMSDEYP